MMFTLRQFLGAFLASLPLLPVQAAAAPVAGPNSSAVPADERKSCFSVGLLGQRHSLKAGDGNEFIGNSGAVQLGYGYIASSWYVSGSLDILLGPYEPVRNKQLNVDYVGTGISFWTGFSAQNMDLRSPAGGYGFALGLSYSDTVGRSVGRNRKEPGGLGSLPTQAVDTRDLVDNYVMRVSNLSVMPAMFFSWLSPPRARGNSPELLMTRLDGYFLTIGIALPVAINYQASYETRSRVDPDNHSQRIPGESKSEKGQLRGYSIQMALTAMLGT